MRPLTIITGIILGSVFSIALGLSVVAFIYLLMEPGNARVEAEAAPLAVSLALFWSLTAVAAASFYSLAKSLNWRYAAQVPLWLGISLVAVYYWPS